MTFNMLRALAIIFGIVLAAAGGVIAYRAFFLEPTAALVISERGVRELPNTLHIAEGIALLIVGAALAFAAALRGRDRSGWFVNKTGERK